MGDFHNPARDDGVLLTAASALAPLIRAQRDRIEQDRRLPQALVEQMRQAQMFQLLLPRSLGGPEASPRTLIAVIQELARADGSAGWCAAVTAIGGVLATNFAGPVAREVFGAGQIATGAINPTGKAVAAPGGFLLSGRWSYCSGNEFADWVLLAAVIHDGDVPRKSSTGAPETCGLAVPRSAVTMIDTWHVSGLRGTGSHDLAVAGLFVPQARMMPMVPAPNADAAPLYRIAPINLLAAALAAVTLGIARAAIDALIELAAIKTPFAANGLLRERPQVHANIGRAEAQIGAAHAFLLAALDTLLMEAATSPSLTARAQARAAATFAAEASARAVDLVHEAAGGSAIQESGVIARSFRDVHAATQHFVICSNSYETIGRVLLGLEPGVPRF